jgi:tRNA dimethylallyltransferase
MVSRLLSAIRQFAKRQLTWFRRMERRGADIHWLDVEMPMDEKLQQIVSLWHMSPETV